MREIAHNAHRESLLAWGPTLAFEDAAQSPEEQKDFIESFAKVRLLEIIAGLTPGAEVATAILAAQTVKPDWGDREKLFLSGLKPTEVDRSCIEGGKFLHIDVAARDFAARAAFLRSTGLSDKQRRSLFPTLASNSKNLTGDLSVEVRRVNGLLRWLRENGADIELFPVYHRSITLHGRSQNRSGQVGSMGAAVSFIDALELIDPSCIVDMVGRPQPPEDGLPANPESASRWVSSSSANTVKAILLKNGRAIVFSSSKDAVIFMNLGQAFSTAQCAFLAYDAVKNNQSLRHQRIHEFAVGEVKTATDPANLHERLGLASRETQTELRTDRFLMMALLTPEILAGGVAGRTMNNRDLTRFSHVFNLHHCWGYDGGRRRNPKHWEYFLASVRDWCGF